MEVLKPNISLITYASSDSCLDSVMNVQLVRMGFLQSQKLRRKSNGVECVASRRIDKERKMQYRSAH